MQLRSTSIAQGTRKHPPLSVWILLIVLCFANGACGGSRGGDPSRPLGDSPPDGAVAEGRILGIDVGDENTNFQAGMWLLALVGLLATAIPAVFLDPSLGFRKRRRRRAGDGGEEGGAEGATLGEDWKRVLLMVHRAWRSYGR
ncbi:uncharacterized protein LOC122243973 [Penaeus japonicus]|uniref:uncharacterized protein LOC122243973 n=1 Tax=Penaeus japonicus TaxID=27405 RepID=UPI001C70E4DB|nr:uncharacterized protein LOC122243973 [Penaeus japonicus]